MDQWEKSPEINKLTHMFNLFSTKEEKIYNEKKTVSTSSGTGKVEQLHVNQ